MQEQELQRKGRKKIRMMKRMSRLPAKSVDVLIILNGFYSVTLVTMVGMRHVSVLRSWSFQRVIGFVLIVTTRNSSLPSLTNSPNLILYSKRPRPNDDAKNG